MSDTSFCSLLVYTWLDYVCMPAVDRKVDQLMQDAQLFQVVSPLQVAHLFHVWCLKLALALCTRCRATPNLRSIYDRTMLGYSETYMYVTKAEDWYLNLPRSTSHAPGE